MHLHSHLQALWKTDPQIEGKPVTISPHLNGATVPQGNGIKYSTPILLVGEGNGSFAASLALLLGSGVGVWPRLLSLPLPALLHHQGHQQKKHI